MENKFSRFITNHRLLTSLLIVFILISIYNIFSRAQEQDNTKPVKKVEEPVRYIVKAPDLPAELDFCGEEVPMENFIVRERLDRELIASCYRHTSTLLYLKRATRWFPVIIPILKEYGVPEDFKYLCVAESGLDNVISPVGATGFWQFMPETAPSYNLKITEEIDERYHVEKSTVAACNYLLDAYRSYGSWTMAAASYNSGRAYVSRQIKNQKVESYYDLKIYNETSRYVFAVLAYKIVFSNPEKYGFSLNDIELYKPYDVKYVEMDSTIVNMVDYAESFGISYNELVYYNPWVRDFTLTNPGAETYIFKIPVK